MRQWDDQEGRQEANFPLDHTLRRAVEPPAILTLRSDTTHRVDIEAHTTQSQQESNMIRRRVGGFTLGRGRSEVVDRVSPMSGPKSGRRVVRKAAAKRARKAQIRVEFGATGELRGRGGRCWRSRFSPAPMRKHTCLPPHPSPERLSGARCPTTRAPDFGPLHPHLQQGTPKGDPPRQPHGGVVMLAVPERPTGLLWQRESRYPKVVSWRVLETTPNDLSVILSRPNLAQQLIEGYPANRFNRVFWRRGGLFGQTLRTDQIWLRSAGPTSTNLGPMLTRINQIFHTYLATIGQSGSRQVRWGPLPRSNILTSLG